MLKVTDQTDSSVTLSYEDRTQEFKGCETVGDVLDEAYCGGLTHSEFSYQEGYDNSDNDGFREWKNCKKTLALLRKLVQDDEKLEEMVQA